MHAVAVAKRGTLALVCCAAGATVGFCGPWVALHLGFVPAVAVGSTLAVGGFSLGWRNRYLAFVSGMWPMALVTTAVIVVIGWTLSGTSD